MATPINSDTINNLLPQTQCRLCGYNGCRPYANALAQGEASINLCLPGGIETLKKLGEILNKDPTPYLEEMEHKQKPPQRAIIREDECIGCTKCIQACPVDAIMGSNKTMHTIIEKDCTGCELCIEPCPVDCIDLISLPLLTTLEKKERAVQALERYENRQKRLGEKENTEEDTLHIESREARQQFIKNALIRQKKKS